MIELLVMCVVSILLYLVS